MLTTQTITQQQLQITTAPSIKATTLQPWIHPHLAQSIDTIKGRQLQASRPVRRGEVLIIDPPYAIIPAVDTSPNPDASNSPLLCSNPQCNRLVPQNDSKLSCPNRCIADVTWCDETCRGTDQTRHEFECTWLKRYAASLRSKWGEYNFGMLWLIVRILARRHVEVNHSNNTDLDSQTSSQNTSQEHSHPRFKTGWQAIEALCGSPETWSHAQVREWTVLVKKYLSTSSLPHNLPNSEVLSLICKEEANSFGLYPRETGRWPVPTPPLDRGEQFGAAVYPTASIANHSCCPNMIHKPDESGRMVFTASRDIEADEECCISYFDMARYRDLKERREHLQSLFRFKCGCARCKAEDVSEETEVQWDAFPELD